MEQFVTAVNELLKLVWTSCFNQGIPKQVQPSHIFEKLSWHNIAFSCEKYQDFEDSCTPNACMVFITKVFSVDILDM